MTEASIHGHPTGMASPTATVDSSDQALAAGAAGERRPDEQPKPATVHPNAGGVRLLTRLAALVEYGLILAGLFLLIYTDHRIASDGKHRYDTLNQLLSGSGLSSFRFPLVGPIFATPMWWLGKLEVFGYDTRIWLKYYNLVLFGLGLLALFLLLRNRLNPVLLRRFLLLMVAGSMIPAHITDFYGEVFTAMTVGIGILVAVAAVTHPALKIVGWIGTILGAANTPAVIPSLGLVGAERSIATRRLRYLIPAVTAAVMVLGENWIRRGSPFDQGYSGESFDYPFLLGILAILVSFGKGLVFFTPGMFLPIRKRITGLYDPDRIDLWRGYKLWMIFVAGMILVYANWWAWNGDTYWGPRFFLIAMFPAALSLAIWLTYRDPRPWTDLLLLGVLVLSIWVATDSSIFETVWPPNCYIDHTYCRFAIEDSRLWYPVRIWPWHLPLRKWAHVAYHVAVLGWLAAPVLARLALNATRWIRETLLPQLRLREWRI